LHSAANYFLIEKFNKKIDMLDESVNKMFSLETSTDVQINGYLREAQYVLWKCALLSRFDIMHFADIQVTALIFVDNKESVTNIIANRKPKNMLSSKSRRQSFKN
jgi:hypothetical protein